MWMHIFQYIPFLGREGLGREKAEGFIVFVASALIEEGAAEKSSRNLGQEQFHLVALAGFDFEPVPIVGGRIDACEGASFSVLTQRVGAVGITAATVKNNLSINANDDDIIGGADGKVLAYCGSGQRATLLWMLSNPDNLSADERIERAAAAGYDLAGLREQL